MSNLAQLGLDIQTDGLKRGIVSLDDLSFAAESAELSTKDLESASKKLDATTGRTAKVIDLQAEATKRLTMSQRFETEAARAHEQATKLLAFQQRNLQFQLVDTATSLASGMPLYMVAMQQGGQIAGIWGAEEGGVGRAFQEAGKMALGMATKFGPIALAVGAVGLAFAGLQHEINETGKVQVGFVDTVLATLAVIGDQFQAAFGPEIKMVGDWFQQAWDWIGEGAAFLVNELIRNIAKFVETAKFLIQGLPRAFTMMGQAAANGFIAAIEYMVNTVAGQINSLMDNIKPVIGAIAQATNNPQLAIWVATAKGLPTDLKFGRVDFGGTQALHDQIEATKDYESTLAEISTHDYVGDIADKARKLALANEEAASGTSAATKALKDHKDQVTEAQKAYRQLAGTIEQTIGGAFASLVSGPITSFDDALSKVMGSLAQLGQQNITGAFSGLLGGGAANDNRLDPIGSMPQWSAIGAFVKSGAEAGTKAGSMAGLDSFFKAIRAEGRLAPPPAQDRRLVTGQTVGVQRKAA